MKDKKNYTKQEVEKMFELYINRNVSLDTDREYRMRIPSELYEKINALEVKAKQSKF